jgi:hypothetical protein
VLDLVAPRATHPAKIAKLLASPIALRSVLPFADRGVEFGAGAIHDREADS